MLIKGIKNLSQLIIDADKDWQAKGITDIRQIAASMDVGHIVQSNGTILQTLAPGAQGYVVTSSGAGKLLTWAPAGGALKYYLPVYLSLSNQAQKNSLAHQASLSPAFTTNLLKDIADDPGDQVRVRQPNLTIAQSTSKRSLDHSGGASPAMGTEMFIIVDGAVSETAAGAQTNETAAAQSPAQNDMHLPPMTPAAGDKYYLGFRYPFKGIWLQQDTAGVGNWQTTWYYWNGAWTPLSEQDYTSQFMASGFHRVWWGTKAADWVQSTIDSLTWYWVKVQVTAYNNQTVLPLGTQAWCII